MYIRTRPRIHLELKISREPSSLHDQIFRSFDSHIFFDSSDGVDGCEELENWSLVRLNLGIFKNEY